MPVSEIFGQYYQDGVIENQDELLVAMHKVSKNLGFEILSEPPRELGTAKGVAYPNEKRLLLIHEIQHMRMSLRYFMN
ncbi:hypothetical protein EYB33_00560 (plasmid) [Lysinibacillus sphaericus]|uniref:hypothetical protein n=1 Tax=Lysinibacillus sphaericus TaxID=1421 RepID=UPI001E5BEC81|nr:hypothetical protein [Lysinibacillus sphaericus]UDK94877.1 hypothetical protein EYB33_00560 [Lysinibacillus sphaericus]